MQLHPFATQFFVTTHSQLKLFHDHHICDHCSLKFPRLQISHMRYPDICRTHATPFLYNSRRRQKLPKTIFLPVIILNRHEIPHRLNLPCIAMTKELYVWPDIPMMY